MILNTTERKDRTKTEINRYPDPVIAEKITPAFIAYHETRAHRLRDQAIAEMIRKGVLAIARGFSALLWPFAAKRRIAEPRRS